MQSRSYVAKFRDYLHILLVWVYVGQIGLFVVIGYRSMLWKSMFVNHQE